MQCSICLLDLKKDVRTLKCEHKYHKNCINEWISKNNTCPLCRDIISVIEASVATHVTVPSNNNIYCHIDKKKKKKVAVIFYILTIIFFVVSYIYHNVSIFMTNDYINNIIKNYNETELNKHDSKTFSGDILIICDIIFFLIYLACNVHFLNNYRKSCVYILYACICISHGIIHGSFQSNTMKYLNDDVLNIFNKNYYNNCIQSILLYGSSFVFNVITLIGVCVYMMELQ